MSSRNFLISSIFAKGMIPLFIQIGILTVFELWRLVALFDSSYFSISLQYFSLCKLLTDFRENLKLVEVASQVFSKIS